MQKQGRKTSKTLEESWPVHWAGGWKGWRGIVSNLLCQQEFLYLDLDHWPPTPKSWEHYSTHGLLWDLGSYLCMTAIFLIEQQWIGNSPLHPQQRLATWRDDQLQRHINMWHAAYYKWDLHQWLQIPLMSNHEHLTMVKWHLNSAIITPMNAGH